MAKKDKEEQKELEETEESEEDEEWFMTTLSFYFLFIF